MNENAETGGKPAINIGLAERGLSLAAGTVLAVNGIKRKTPLALAAAGLGGYLLFRGASGHCPLHEAMGKKHFPDPARNINIRTTLFVNRPRQEVYNFWRNLSNLPLFMTHLKSVKNIDETRSKWKAWLPGKLGTIKWKAEIVKDEPGHLLGWNALKGSTIDNAGKVEFRDVEGGTELRVIITYRAPLGAIGESLARLFTPTFEKMIEEDIQGFKVYIESGVRAEKKKHKKQMETDQSFRL